MHVITLNGPWALFQGDDDQTPIAAQVPGCVHMDLLAAGLLPDPFIRDNESRQFWIGETDWTYRRAFDVSADVLAHDRVTLRCHGLDTLAAIALNGKPLAQTDNMFRTYEFDVKPHLVAGENVIAIRFAAPMPYLRQQEAEKGMLFAWSVGQHRLNSGAWLRKEPCNFGWDWGPMLVTSGIWRDIELAAFNTARLDDVLIRQAHAPDRVDLTVHLGIERCHVEPLTASITVEHAGTIVAHAPPVLVAGDGADIALTVHDPQLWWPNGMGDQPLYKVTVRLFDAADNVLDTVTKCIGLRTLTLERHLDAWGETFQFAANGVPFFAKGANWIPADTFAPRLTRAHIEHLIRSAADAHMNMLRVWGGGLYESDEFYDLCDECGICVWQDFIFSCGTYPTYNADFMQNVRAEAQDNVRRIRHHASLALWCGNNELEQGLVGPEWTATTMSWDDYSTLFDMLLREVVAEHDPQRDYWPGSPHSPHGDRHDWRNPACGDMHNWDVWHDQQPFEHYRSTRHRFISEFGFQSFPEPRTTHAFTAAEDRNLTSYIMEYHQRSGIGNSTIAHYLLDWFRLPTSFEALLWLSQILQGIGVKIGVEHWRRTMPRTMGTLYWQLNDCWPGPSWSSIDHAGRWKALHYMAKRFYAPLLLSALEDADAGTVALHVTSDEAAPVDGQIRWTLSTVDGTPVEQGTIPVTIAPRQNTPVTTLDLSRHMQRHDRRSVLLWIELATPQGIVAKDLVTFARPKHLALPAPHIQASTQVRGTDAEITLETDAPALYVWLEWPDHDAVFSDNFFHLHPHAPHTITLYHAGSDALDTLHDRLVVRSLVDTFQ